MIRPKAHPPVRAASAGEAHFPAFSAGGCRGNRVVWGVDSKPEGLLEFPKNSININKFTGFFDKLLKIIEGKCGDLRGIAGPQLAQMRGIARVKISRPQKHREDTTSRRTRAAAIAGNCAGDRGAARHSGVRSCARFVLPGNLLKLVLFLLHPQEFSLSFHTPAIARKAPVGPYRPVTRHQQRHRVLGACASHRPRAFRQA